MITYLSAIIQLIDPLGNKKNASSKIHTCKHG